MANSFAVLIPQTVPGLVLIHARVCTTGGFSEALTCVLRFDSWAGMALARASRIQEKLNSNELKSDLPIWKHSQAVLNCFKRALEIDGSNLSLWIEYGTISYALHSFASRQLKQWRSELPPEVVEQVSRGDSGQLPAKRGSHPPFPLRRLRWSKGETPCWTRRCSASRVRPVVSATAMKRSGSSITCWERSQRSAKRPLWNTCSCTRR